MQTKDARTKRKRRVRLGLAALVVPVAVLIPTMAYAGAGQDDLAQVRQVTRPVPQRRCRDRCRVRARLGERLRAADHHRLHRPPHGGGDGLPLLQRGADGRQLAVDASKPEVLVYAPGPDGNLKLVAVEWVVPSANSNPPGVSEPPSVLGMPMHILVPPPGPAFYIMHAWVWADNPAGMFADWNPEVSCA